MIVFSCRQTCLIRNCLAGLYDCGSDERVSKAADARQYGEMARDPRYVHVNLLTWAIEQARPLLRWAIDRAELRGSLIKVDAAGESVFFHVNMSQSEQLDEITGQAFPIAGGERYALVQVTELMRAEAEATWRKDEERKRQAWWHGVFKRGR